MPGLTVKGFINAFKERHGWECAPNTRITNDLTEFAKDREGSSRDIEELYTIFCISKGLQPYPSPKE